MAEGISTREIENTVWLFGKPYHWSLGLNGRLSLVAGPTEHEKIRWEVTEMLIGKGVAPEDIDKEMIDKVINKAEGLAIEEATDAQ